MKIIKEKYKRHPSFNITDPYDDKFFVSIYCIHLKVYKNIRFSLFP